jgi:hypothetical protein
MSIEDVAEEFSQTEEEYVGWVTYLTIQACYQPARYWVADEMEILRDRLDHNRLIIRHPKNEALPQNSELG